MVKKTPGKSLVKWDEELATLAKETTTGLETPTGKFISIRSGKMTFAGADVPGNELRAVLLGWTFENQYYEGKFDPDARQTPACYAFGTDTTTMAPHPQAPDKQHGDCASCPMNQWGSSDTSDKGKACKNVVRLALIAESDLEGLAAADVVYLKVPVMSVKNFTMYAKKTVAEALGRPFWAVVTAISVVPDKKAQFKVNFEVADNIEDSDLFQPLKDLWTKVMEGIDFPYPQLEEEEKSAKKKPINKKSKFAR